MIDFFNLDFPLISPCPYRFYLVLKRLYDASNPFPRLTNRIQLDNGDKTSSPIIICELESRYRHYPPIVVAYFYCWPIQLYMLLMYGTLLI